MSTEAPIRWGIVGTGSMAHTFARELDRMPNSSLAAVTSRNLNTAQSFCAAIGGTQPFDSLARMLADSRPDVVYIATPHHRHADDATMCIEAGIPVLCEKPIAATLDDASRMVAAARAANVFLMEGMWMRCFPAVQRAAKIVRDGGIGQPRLMRADFSVAQTFEPTHRLFDAASFGGALLDRGVYAVSLATLLLGKPESIESLSTTAASNVDEQVVILLRFESGALATLSASLSCRSTNDAVIAGSHGMVSLGSPFYAPDRVKHQRFRPFVTGPAGRAGGQTSLKGRVLAHPAGRFGVRAAKALVQRPTVHRHSFAGTGHSFEIAEVERCLRLGLTESPLMRLDESLVVMKVLEQVRNQISRV